MRARSAWIDWALLIACNLIWASQFVLAKLVQEEMGPIFATFLPMALATALLMPMVLHERRSRAPAAGSHGSAGSPWAARSHSGGNAPSPAVAAKAGGASGGDVLRFAVIGIFGQFVAQLGITWGVRFAPASNAALLSLTLPIATAVMAFLLLGERMTAVRWASFGLAVAGVLQCSGVDWNDLRFASSGVLMGNVLIMVGVLGSAFYNVYGKKLLERFSPLEVLLYSYYAVLAALLPLTLYLEPGSFHALLSYGPKVWLGILLLAGLQYFLSMILFLSVLTRLDAVQAGLSNYLIPVFGVLIAGIALGERLTTRMVMGGLVVLASTLLITVHEERRAARPPGTAAAT